MLMKSLRFLLPSGAAATAILSMAAASPANVAPAASVTLTDTFGYVWALTIDEQTAEGWFLGGTCTTTFDSRNGNGLLLLSNGGINLLADGGSTAIPFAYSLKFKSGTGDGIWTNQTGPASFHGTVSATVTGPNPPPPPTLPDNAIRPGALDVE